MHKELPIIIENIPFSGLQYSYILSILFTFKEVVPLLIENYISIFGGISVNDNVKSNPYGYSDGYSYDCCCVDRNPIDIHNFDDIVLRHLDIIELIKDFIENNYYVIVFVDEYFLPLCSMGERSHFLHEQLIYGYDDEILCFFAVGIKKSGQYGKIKHSFTELQNAFKRGYDIRTHGTYEWLQSHRVIAIKKNNRFADGYTYPFSISRFSNKLSKFVSEKTDEGIQYCIEYKPRKFNFYYDIDFYKIPGIVKITKKYFSYFRFAHHAYEHAIGIKRKLNFINDHYNIPQLVQNISIFDLNICRVLSEMRIRSLKYQVKEEHQHKQNNIFIDKFIEESNEVADQYKVILPRIVSILDDTNQDKHNDLKK
jgi:hypothetical protein